LPSGTTWYVNLSNGQSFSGTGTTITFSEPNGTYSYTIATVNKNYATSPSSGTFTVNGATINNTILFNYTKQTYYPWLIVLGGLLALITLILISLYRHRKKRK
jgi:hypothetical protein